MTIASYIQRKSRGLFSRSLINPISKMKITIRSIGINQYPLLVVDNFYADPQAVVKLTRSLKFTPPSGKHIHALATLNRSTKTLYQTLFELYGRQFDIPSASIMMGRVDEWRFFQSVPSGSDLPTRREQPHTDASYYLAGLVYLTPDEHCSGGTGFFRHRFTGADEKPPTAAWLAGRKVAPHVLRTLERFDAYRAFHASKEVNYDAYCRNFQLTKSDNRFHLHGSNADWELTELAEMKFNRLIMYPAFLFHHAVFKEDDFDKAENGRRLTQNFFFKYPRL